MKKCKKVCVFTSHPIRDRRVFRREAVSLARAGFDVTIIGKDDGGDCAGEEDGVRLVPVKKRPGHRGRIAFLREVRRLALAQQDVDVYHTHDYDQMSNAMHIRRKTRRPVVLDIHERYAENYAPRVPLLGKIAPKLAEKVLEWYENRCARALGNVILVYDEEVTRFDKLGCNILHLDNYATKRDFPTDVVTDEQWQRRKHVVHTGLLTPVRGSDVLLELGKRLEESHPETDVHLVELFYSNGQRDAFDRRRAECGPCASLKYLPVVPANELKGYLKNALVGIVMLDARGPLRYARPTKPYEYMAMSIPIVATRWGLTERVIEESGAGILVDGLDPEGYIQAVQRLIDNPALAREMGEAGRRAFLDEFNWEVVEPALIDYFRTIAGVDDEPTAECEAPDRELVEV